MLRVLGVLLLTAAIVSGVVYYFELTPAIVAIFQPSATETTGSAPSKQEEEKPAQKAVVEDGARQPLELGKDLYQRAPDLNSNVAAAPASARPDPIVVPGCHLTSTEIQNVPSPREGRLLFIGTEVDSMAPEGSDIFKAPIDLAQRIEYRRYRRLKENDIVAPGQMLALVDPAVAINEVETKEAKVLAAQADYVAAQAMQLEAVERFKTTDRLFQQKAATLEEWRAAGLAKNKYYQDEVSKQEGLKVARIEANQTRILLKQHTITNTMHGHGVIKTLFKQPGEAVKSLDQVMQLYNIEKLRAEGLVEVQYLNQLRRGMKGVIIEPQVEEAPLRVLYGHRGEVTCVAVSNDPQAPLVVSGSLDRTVCVWSGTHNTPRRVLPHDSAIRSIVCAPKELGKNWCLVGCDDGTLQMWDLNNPEQKSVWKKETTHHTAVTALAFTPDGKFFATGSECNNIAIWETETGTLRYILGGLCGASSLHQGAVHSLHFTPQGRLVSAARDNTLRVWEVHQNGVKPGPIITDRGGNVTQLGVSPDGRWMLFDKGRTLQLLSLPEGITSSLLQNPLGSTSFETLALFSPDSKLILTAGAPEGRLQLWKAPLENARAYEVRTFVTSEKDPVTCAAFAPSGKFAVSGTKGNLVYLWGIPDREAVEQHQIRNLNLTTIEQALDANNRQVRIGVDVPNPVDAQNSYGRWRPGMTVTVVIER